MDFNELKYIVEYPRYAASPDGRIYSFKSDKYLKPVTTRNGYLVVTLTKHGKTKQVHIHRVIASLFCKRPTGATQVNHINGIKSDPRAVNLEWCTAAENSQHAWDTGLCINQVGEGEDNPSSKLTDNIVENIIVSFMSGKSLKAISKELGVNRNTIAQITSGNTWHHVSKRLGYVPKTGFKKHK